MCKAHRGVKTFWGLEAQDTLKARVFLSEAPHMSNIYFTILMMVVSYFYLTFSQNLAILVNFLLLLHFYKDYRVVGRVRAFFGVETW